MLTDSDLQLAEHLKHALIEHNVPLYKAIVFGSRARGDAQPDSDLDVLVLVEHITPALRKTISHCAWEVGYEAGHRSPGGWRVSPRGWAWGTDCGQSGLLRRVLCGARPATSARQNTA